MKRDREKDGGVEKERERGKVEGEREGLWYDQ
jgi:hypothetical protein